jgi:hypothetical protein
MLRTATSSKAVTADHRRLQAVLVDLLEEAEAVRAGEAEEDAVDVRLELRDVAAVVGRIERREQLLHERAARILVHLLEAAEHLVPVGEVVGDRRHALVLQVLGAVVGHRVRALRRGGGRAHEPGIRLALGHVFAPATGRVGICAVRI